MPDLVKAGVRLVAADNFSDANPASVRQGRFEFEEQRLAAGLQRSMDLVDRWHGR